MALAVGLILLVSALSARLSVAWKASAALAPCAASPLAFATMFRSQAVLQRQPARAAVWGSAPPLARVTIHLEGAQSQNATAGADGTWHVRLPAQAAGWRRRLAVRHGACVVEVAVSFGETLLCSGQVRTELEGTRACRDWANLVVVSTYVSHTPHLCPTVEHGDAGGSHQPLLPAEPTAAKLSLLRRR